MANLSVSVPHESISFSSHFPGTLWAVPSGFYDSDLIPKQWKLQASGGSSWKVDRSVVKSVLSLGYADLNLTSQF